jgi:DNA-binding NtrC family response regulator
MIQATPNPLPRILIVDDDRILIQSLAQLLRRLGYIVATCDQPHQTVDQLQATSSDLLLIDPHSTDIDLPELLRDIKTRFPTLVTVIITAYGSIESAVEAVKMGAFDYLTKPIIDEEIRTVVEKAARHHSLLFENHTLRQQLDLRLGFENIIGHNHQMSRVFDLLGAVADSKTTVLMQGESGTGKTLIARAIHHHSARRSKPFIEVSCGALPENLLESELFGHVRGAFTGAVSDKPGRFLAADGGTIFLDEINSATPAMQVKLLRVLQDRAFEPVGSSVTKTVDVRVILASNVDLASLVTAGSFRQDLYYRVNVVSVRLPPLRDRAGDVPLLARSFLARISRDMGRDIAGFTDEALARLSRYPWPGNVRELENAVERAVIVTRSSHVDVHDLPETLHHSPATPAEIAAGGPAFSPTPASLATAIDHAERDIIHTALRRHNWNRNQTAAELAIDRTTLYKKMRKHRLDVGESN